MNELLAYNNGETPKLTEIKDSYFSGSLFEINYLPGSNLEKIMKTLIMVDSEVRKMLDISDDHPDLAFYLIDNKGINIIRGMDPEESEFFVNATASPYSFSVYINYSSFLDANSIGISFETIIENAKFISILTEEVIHCYSLRREKGDGVDKIYMALNKDPHGNMPSDERYCNPLGGKLLLIQPIEESYDENLDARFAFPVESYFIEAMTALIKTIVLTKILKFSNSTSEWSFLVHKSDGEGGFLSSNELREIFGINLDRVFLKKMYQILMGDGSSIPQFIKALKNKRSKTRFQDSQALFDGLTILFECIQKYLSNTLTAEDILELSKFDIVVAIRKLMYRFEDGNPIPYYESSSLSGAAGSDLLPTIEG